PIKCPAREYVDLVLEGHVIWSGFNVRFSVGGWRRGERSRHRSTGYGYPPAPAGVLRPKPRNFRKPLDSISCPNEAPASGFPILPLQGTRFTPVNAMAGAISPLNPWQSLSVGRDILCRTAPPDPSPGSTGVKRIPYF